MDVFNIFDDLDFLLVGKYMVAELLIGAIAGIIFKQVAKLNANRSSNTQVFQATDYSSRYFGKNFPTDDFDVFRLPPEFIVVQYGNDEVISENFFTFLGNSTKAEYQNGQYRGNSSSALSSPTYLTTIVIPVLLGFFSAVLPFADNVNSSLFLSGLIWLFITFYITPILFNLRRNETSNTE